MEIASQEDHDMPIPISTSYGGHGHMIHHLHHHHHANSSPSPVNITTTNPLIVNNGHGKTHEHPHHQHVGYNIIINNKTKEKTMVIKYKECLKNHAASMGGNALDGCGEFMPNGEEGSIEALTCSACNCHRNFHRREIEGEENTFFPMFQHNHHKIQHNHHKMVKSPLPQQMIMPIGVASNSESEDLMEEDGGTFRQPQPPPQPYGGYNQKKRFRTKFTQEQKEKMMSFAERVGWKMQRQDESVVQQFCQEIGVRRRVLKVWMHNNKHNLSKKSNNVELSAGYDENNKANDGNLASSP